MATRRAWQVAAIFEEAFSIMRSTRSKLTDALDQIAKQHFEQRRLDHAIRLATGKPPLDPPADLPSDLQEAWNDPDGQRAYITHALSEVYRDVQRDYAVNRPGPRLELAHRLLARIMHQRPEVPALAL